MKDARDAYYKRNRQDINEVLQTEIQTAIENKRNERQKLEEEHRRMSSERHDRISQRIEAIVVGENQRIQDAQAALAEVIRQLQERQEKHQELQHELTRITHAKDNILASVVPSEEAFQSIRAELQASQAQVLALKEEEAALIASAERQKEIVESYNSHYTTQNDHRKEKEKIRSKMKMSKLVSDPLAQLRDQKRSLEVQLAALEEVNATNIMHNTEDAAWDRLNADRAKLEAQKLAGQDYAVARLASNKKKTQVHLIEIARKLTSSAIHSLIIQWILEVFLTQVPAQLHAGVVCYQCPRQVLRDNFVENLPKWMEVAGALLPPHNSAAPPVEADFHLSLQRLLDQGILSEGEGGMLSLGAAQ